MINQEKITAQNMAKLTEDALEYCLFKEGDNSKSRLEVEGIAHNYVFDSSRLEEKRELIMDIINELPEEFKEGSSFLNLCMNRYGQQWYDFQMTGEDLVVMAIGLGLMRYYFPKPFWNILPGGVPYIIVTTD